MNQQRETNTGGPKGARIPAQPAALLKTDDVAPSRYEANAEIRERRRRVQLEEAEACARAVEKALEAEAKSAQADGNPPRGLSLAQLGRITGYDYAALNLAVEIHLLGRLRGSYRGQIEYFVLKEA